jgi:hypothetical protein
MMTITYSNTYLTMKGERQKNGSLFEMDDAWEDIEGYNAGRLFPSVSAWIAALDAETVRRAPWAKKHHKLSVEEEESSVVWVESKQHYMEVRRGSQTKFTATGRRYWLSLEEWLAFLGAAGPVIPVAVPVVVASEIPVAVPVNEEVPVAIPVPVAVAVPVVNPPFNPEKFQKDFDGLIAWARGKCAQTKPAAIVQICAWLLEMKARPGSTYRADGRSDLAIWLEETPLWRVSIRTIVQAREWEWSTPASAAAVAAFLTTF